MDDVISRLNAILSQHASKRVNGQVASEQTKTNSGQALRTCFRDLIELGFKISDPRNLTEKHIAALCVHWYGKGIQVSTISERLSRLRVFCRWINKPGMVKTLSIYLPNMHRTELKARKAAVCSKSWSELGIDVAEKIRDADALDRRFGLMLRLMLSFGLRRMEVVQLVPWKSDHGDRLAIYKAKNGRPRDILIDTLEQRTVLNQVKAGVRKHESLGWPTMQDGSQSTLAYTLQRYNKLMARIGITRAESKATGHGLRAQFAENAALIAGVLPPTLGGTGDQLPRDDLNVKRAQVSELLGHSRTSVTNAYYGSFGRAKAVDPSIMQREAKASIEHALANMSEESLIPISAEHVADAAVLSMELDQLGIMVAPRQVALLWRVHSKRHNTEWATLQADNSVALVAAARSMVGTSA